MLIFRGVRFYLLNLQWIRKFVIQTLQHHTGGFQKSNKATFLGGIYNNNLGGGNSNMFYFHPKNWGRWTHFDINIFQRGWFNHQQQQPIATKAWWIDYHSILLLLSLFFAKSTGCGFFLHSIDFSLRNKKGLMFRGHWKSKKSQFPLGKTLEKPDRLEAFSAMQPWASPSGGASPNFPVIPSTKFYSLNFALRFFGDRKKQKIAKSVYGESFCW